MSGKEDPLLKRARQAEDRAKRASKKASSIADSIGQIGDRFGKIRSFFRRLSKYTGPIGRFIAWFARKVGVGLKWSSYLREPHYRDKQGHPNYSILGRVFKKLAGEERAKTLEHSIFYKKDFQLDDNGDLIFSKNRIAKSFVGFVAALVIMHVTLSAVYFYSTHFEETVYTSGGKQELTKGDLYEFTGCTSLPCSTKLENGKFYMIESSWYFPTLVYPEEHVYAAVPEQDGVCHIKGYGLYFKNLKFLHHTFQWYQKVYQVTCSPLTEEEKRNVINKGALPVIPGTETKIKKGAAGSKPAN